MVKAVCYLVFWHIKMEAAVSPHLKKLFWMPFKGLKHGLF
jgi:hypothetical protein